MFHSKRVLQQLHDPLHLHLPYLPLLALNTPITQQQQQHQSAIMPPKRRAAATAASAAAAPPPKKSKPAPHAEIGKLQKNEDGSPFWEIGGQHRRVAVSEFRGTQLVSIREHYENDGKLLPGKKGISLSVEQLNTFISILPQIEKYLAGKQVDVTRPVYGVEEAEPEVEEEEAKEEEEEEVSEEEVEEEEVVSEEDASEDEGKKGKKKKQART